MRKHLLVALALGVLVGSAGAAQAQEPPSAPPPADALRFEGGAFVIQGKVQKPEVVVVIKRESVERAFDLDLDESFLERIVSALDEAPF